MVTRKPASPPGSKEQHIGLGRPALLVLLAAAAQLLRRAAAVPLLPLLLLDGVQLGGPAAEGREAARLPALHRQPRRHQRCLQHFCYRAQNQRSSVAVLAAAADLAAVAAGRLRLGVCPCCACCARRQRQLGVE